MGLNRTSTEAAKKWLFAPAPAQTARRQEIVFEFRRAGYCDLEPPSFERVSDYRLRVWKQREMRDGIKFVMTTSRCIAIVEAAPQCAF